jgi:ABC-type transporter Mla subunit MlaD
VQPTEFRISPRFLGYSIVIAGLLLVFFLAAFLLREAVHTGRTVWVRFPEIATLAEGDPVVQNGVTVGKVEQIVLIGRDADAQLLLFTHDPLPVDTRIINLSHSLMGARKVWLIPGSSEVMMDETKVQTGFFAPGLSETLHNVRALTDRVSELRRETEIILAGNGKGGTSSWSPAAIQHNLEVALRSLDTLSTSVEAAFAGLSEGLAMVSTTGATIHSGLRTAEPKLNNAMRRIDSILITVQESQRVLDAALTAAEKVAAVVEDTSGVGRLLTNRDAYDQMTHLVQTLTETARYIREVGVGENFIINPHIGKSGGKSGGESGGK